MSMCGGENGVSAEENDTRQRQRLNNYNNASRRPTHTGKQPGRVLGVENWGVELTAGVSPGS